MLEQNDGFAIDTVCRNEALKRDRMSTAVPAIWGWHRWRAAVATSNIVDSYGSYSDPPSLTNTWESNHNTWYQCSSSSCLLTALREDAYESHSDRNWAVMHSHLSAPTVTHVSVPRQSICQTLNEGQLIADCSHASYILYWYNKLEAPPLHAGLSMSFDGI